jgi:hypothetical protein
MKYSAFFVVALLLCANLVQAGPLPLKLRCQFYIEETESPDFPDSVLAKMPQITEHGVQMARAQVGIAKGATAEIKVVRSDLLDPPSANAEIFIQINYLGKTYSAVGKSEARILIDDFPIAANSTQFLYASCEVVGTVQ